MCYETQALLTRLLSLLCPWTITVLYSQGSNMYLLLEKTYYKPVLLFTEKQSQSRYLDTLVIVVLQLVGLVLVYMYKP